MGRVLGILFIAAIGAGVALFHPSAVSASEAPSRARSHVLILYDEDKSLPGLAVLDRSLRDSLHAGLGAVVEFYSESLSLSQFERAGYDRLVVDFYGRKYSGKKVDLIVAVMEPSLDFLLRHGEALFPGVPIVFCGVDAATIEGKTLRANITGVLVRREFSPTLEAALRLQPNTRNVFVVGGASTFDRHLQSLVRRDLHSFEDRVTITYLVGLPMDALLKAVARLPANSVILYVTVFSDGVGIGFVPHDVLSSIATTANAPVYVFVDQFVGRGAVGGNVYSLDSHASQVAALGLQILRGARPQSLPIRELGSQVNSFDARQLRRWRLDETRLPPASVISDRETSAWELYKWYIVGAITVVVTQGALLTSLLVARARRGRAEAEARRQREELAHVLRVTTLGELTTSLAHEIIQPLAAIMTNSQAARRLVERGNLEVNDLREALTDITADAQRAAEVVRRLRTLVRKERVEPVPVDVNALVKDVVGLLRADMLARGIDVRLELEDATPFVIGDPILLQQVVLNIVMNAADAIGAAAAGPRAITITTGQPQPGRLAVEIRDTGVGVKDAELERIFEHFVSTKPQGLGMGLAISRSIITAHGGRIWATANAGRGLIMHIELMCSSETPGSMTGNSAERVSPPFASSGTT